MPIVDVELIADEGEVSSLHSELTQNLADALGSVFGSAPGETWVRLRGISRAQYAENGSPLPSTVRPVFVTVLRSRWPAKDQMRREAAEIAWAVAKILERARENVHVIYSPEAEGRMAFGGTLVDDPP